METIKVRKLNEVFLKIECSQGCKKELHEYFSFFAPNYRFHPKFKKRLWDGKIKMFNMKTNTLYVGLMKKLAIFCKERQYNLDCDFKPIDKSFSETEFDEIIKLFHLSKIPRDYQKEAIIKAIRRKRITFLSPTASGKSFIIYLIYRILNLKTLLIVPTTALCLQMKNDFDEYSENDDSWLVDDEFSIIMGGYSKENLKHMTCSTWQSLYEMPKQWFDEQQFECVILDECHSGKAQSIQTIMENIEDAQYRIGLTGTLEDTQMSEMTVTGLFGPVHEVTETKSLIENQTLSDLNIKCIEFHYSNETKRNFKKNYQEEIDFLISHDKRNKFLINLALSLKGNTLLLFGRVEKHGKILYNEILKKAENKGKKVFYVSGEIGAKTREEIRLFVENEKKDCIIVASSGTFSTGINIVNLHNIIQGHPTKSKIKVLQSIGRGLRKGEDKDVCTYFDISDNLKWKSSVNHTYKHFIERLKIYIKSGFNYKMYELNLEE